MRTIPGRLVLLETDQHIYPFNEYVVLLDYVSTDRIYITRTDGYTVKIAGDGKGTWFAQHLDHTDNYLDLEFRANTRYSDDAQLRSYVRYLTEQGRAVIELWSEEDLALYLQLVSPNPCDGS